MKNSYHTFFTNLANPLKIEIVLELRKGEKNVSELVKSLKGEQSKISHALSNLKNCNIVVMKKKGKQRVYYLNEETILPILKILDKHSKTFCNKDCCWGCKRKH
jgi:DNA-binding transcriptional ArsR family regulator